MGQVGELAQNKWPMQLSMCAYWNSDTASWAGSLSACSCGTQLLTLWLLQRRQKIQPVEKWRFQQLLPFSLGKTHLKFGISKMKILANRWFETFCFVSTLCVRKSTNFQLRSAKTGCFILDTSFDFQLNYISMKPECFSFWQRKALLGKIIILFFLKDSFISIWFSCPC